MVDAIGVLAVRPKGSDPIVGELEAGEYEVKVVATYDNNELDAEYPGGFVRHHQAVSVDALIPKIISNIEARHGVTPVITSKPDAIAEGAIFKLEIG